MLTKNPRKNSWPSASKLPRVSSSSSTKCQFSIVEKCPLPPNPLSHSLILSPFPSPSPPLFLAVAQRFKEEFECSQQQLPGSGTSLADDLSKLSVQDDKENQDKTTEETKGAASSEGGDEITAGSGDVNATNTTASPAAPTQDLATKDDEPAAITKPSKEETSVSVGDS